MTTRQLSKAWDKLMDEKEINTKELYRLICKMTDKQAKSFLITLHCKNKHRNKTV